MMTVHRLLSCSWVFRTLIVLLLVAFGTRSPQALAEEQAAPPAARSEAKFARSPITISPESTVIDGPVLENGYIDYVAALNQQLSAGVTVENNAAVLMLQVTGPKELGNHAEQYCEMLGIPQLPLVGNYLVVAERFEVADQDPAITEQRLAEHDRALKGPWTAKELPVLARWLEQHAPQFELIEKATQRPRYYTPLIAGKPAAVVAVGLPQAQTSRTLARSLMIRCMFRLGQGDVRGAWSDIQSMHRLARLVGQGSTLIEGLVGISINAMAHSATVQVAQSEHLTPELAAAILKDVDQLTPVCNMADKVNVAERYMFLDSVGLILREGPDGLGLLESNTQESPTAKVIGQIVLQSVDADQTLRMGNRWYDRIVAEMRLPTFAERRTVAELTNKDLAELKSNTTGANAAITLLAGTSQERGEMFGEVLISLLLPAIQHVEVAMERSRMTADLSRIALALRIHHLKTGAFPAELQELVPGQLPELPTDRFTGQPLRYTGTETHSRVMSAGKNGKFDTELNTAPENNVDDLVIELNVMAEE